MTDIDKQIIEIYIATIVNNNDLSYHKKIIKVKKIETPIVL